MRAAIRIATKDLRLRVRDRSAFIIGIIAPLALAVILNLVFGSTFEEDSIEFEYGMVDLDQSQTSHTFSSVLTCLEEEGILAMYGYESASAAEMDIEADVIDAFYLIEPGLNNAVFSAEGYTVRVIGDVDAQIATQVATSIAEQFGQGVSTFQLSARTTAALGGTPQPPQANGTEIQCGDEGETGQSFVVADVSAATRQLDSTTYFAAGMAVFFLFFTVQFGVLGLLEEEQDGTLARLLAAPIARTSVILGKAILAFLLGIISMGVLVVGTQLLIGADWGAPLGVALLVITGVLSAIGIMALVAAVAKTAEGAGNLGAIIAVILGMLGGVFFPIGQGDDFLAKLTLITPHAWFMRGLGDLADGAPWTDALPAAGAILAFAAVTGSIGWVLLRRRFRG